MKVGILGTGDVGRSLGRGFIGLGHDVMMGSREPSSEKVRQWVTEAGSRAKQTVAEICKAFGWPAIDISGIEGARLLEPLCILWVIYGIRAGSWNHAFKLLRR